MHFEVRPAHLPAERRAGEEPSALARRLAAEKALAVARDLGPSPLRWVLGADTVVVLDGDVLGKPVDPEDALRMLERLAGRRHRVITGVALVDSRSLDPRVVAVTSEVTMRAEGADALRAYVATGESLDKAGSYALQGEGRGLVEGVEGSESNVIGLPLDETLALLREAGAHASAP